MEYASSNLDVREAEDLCNAFELAESIVYRNYINRIEMLNIVKTSSDFLQKEIGSEVRLIKVEKIVYDKDENNLQKLTNVYNMAYSLGLNVVLLLTSDGTKVQLYLGICQENDNSKLKLGIESLYHGFVGNFPGSLDELSKVLLENKESKNLIAHCTSDDKKSISVVSGVAGARKEKEDENIKFIQGIEKLVDSMRGVPFSAIIIANPVNKSDLKEMKNELETLYSSLKPFEKTVMNFSESHADGVSNSMSKGLSDSYGSSKSKSLSLGTTESTSKTKGYSVGGNANVGSMVSTALTIGASLALNPGALLGQIGLGQIGALLGPIGGNIAKTISQGVSGSLGLNASVQRSTTKTEGTSKTNTETDSTNEQHTETNTNTDTTTATDTTGNSIQIEYINKNIKQLLDQIDVQLTRIRKCESYGVFAVASYFLAKNAGYSSMAASAYKSIISGENTFVESANITTWSDEAKVKELKKYLSRMYHPVFELKSGTNVNDVTAVSIVSGNELAIHLGMPKKSVTGVVVSECASFGRNTYIISGKKLKKIQKEDGKEILVDKNTIELGKIYHMCSDEDTKVKLCVDDLSMHTFITGATGSGKSNAVYTLLSKLDKEEVNFLVIEPAKGEYKHVFGNRKDVQVYGTNPKKNRMLKINPFSFPDDIHVLEHIDRLIEIFNVCWPMYAAMPAVLKEAVERAYTSIGWNLNISENASGEKIYPSFSDVLSKLDEVVEQSEFSDEVKSNYAGALLTRVRSLTNGINGSIFSGNEIIGNDLFDSNVIIDLSRVGASDTKALIMGILVMKLQEYRVDQGGMNQALKHVTILEEAHNLLKASGSSPGSSEGADLVGKSVEMISNIIAEVRTYGEGFIIADQAPGLLDASVIRNTNTKIILRLPDYSDRQLVGKAANLKDSQIEELAKLPVGVAAVYHNDWLEPVLCHIEKYDANGEYPDCADKNSSEGKCEILKYLKDSMTGKELASEEKEKVERLLKQERISSELKVKLLAKIKSGKPVDETIVSKYIIDVYGDCDSAFCAASEANDIKEWNDILVKNIDQQLLDLDIEYQNIVVRNILNERAKNDIHFEDMSLKWINYMTRHGLI